MKMEKKFFDWEDDNEFKKDASITRFPLSEEEKNSNIAKDIADGYTFSDMGMLQKEITITPSRTVSYDPDDVLLDDAGRKYFIDEFGQRTYFDDLDNIYSIRVNQMGEVEEFMVVGKGEIMVFANPEHTLAVKNGDVYEYDPNTMAYIYQPDIVLFKDIQKR